MQTCERHFLLLFTARTRSINKITPDFHSVAMTRRSTNRSLSEQCARMEAPGRQRLGLLLQHRRLQVTPNAICRCLLIGEQSAPEPCVNGTVVPSCSLTIVALRTDKMIIHRVIVSLPPRFNQKLKQTSSTSGEAKKKIKDFIDVIERYVVFHG